MRSWARSVVVSLCILLLSACVVLPGCSDSKDMARKYIDQGDSILEDVQSESETLGESIQSVMDRLCMNLGTGGVPDSEQFKSEVDSLSEMFDRITEKAKAAMEEYSEVLDLSGVDDYVRYAELQIETIEIMQGLTEKWRSFLYEVVEMLKDYDQETFVAKYDEMINEMNRVNLRAADLQEEALELRGELDL